MSDASREQEQLTPRSGATIGASDGTPAPAEIGRVF
jgi:hypothetical protein